MTRSGASSVLDTCTIWPWSTLATSPQLAGTLRPPGRIARLSGRLTTPLAAATGTGLVLVALVLVLLAGFVVVLLSGRAVVSYVAFASGPVVGTVLAALLSRRADQLAADLATVKHATNSVMVTQFAAAADARSTNETNRADAVAGIMSRIDQIPVVLPPQGIPSAEN
jgi:hypothetical protein